MSTKPLILSTESARRKVLLTLKKYSYLIAMLPLALPPLLLAAGQATGWVNLFAWGVPVVVLASSPSSTCCWAKTPLTRTRKPIPHA